MRAAERAPSDPFHVLERRHGLVEIVDRGTGVHAERLRVNRPHFEREFMNLSKNAPRQGGSIYANSVTLELNGLVARFSRSAPRWLLSRAEVCLGEKTRQNQLFFTNWNLGLSKDIRGRSRGRGGYNRKKLTPHRRPLPPETTCFDAFPSSTLPTRDAKLSVQNVSSTL